MADESCLNLIEDIGSIKGYDLAIFTTYSFDAVFFENVLLRDIKRNNPGINIIVLVDANHYPKPYEMTDATGKEYLLLPVAVALFHPKIFLFLSEKNGIIYIGSHNLTPSGITHNLELTYKSEELSLVYSCITFFEELFSRILIKENPLNKALLNFENSLKTNKKNGNDVYLINNLHRPILETILDYLKETSPGSEVTVFAPFWSNELELLEQINSKIKPKKIDLCIQRKNHNLNIDNVLTLPFVSIKEVISNEDRLIHSKFMIFRGKQDFVFVGSPNFTDPALNRTIDTGNVELALLLPLEKSLDIFGDLTYQEITADDVRNSKRDDSFFTTKTEVRYDITIQMANVDGLGQLHLTINAINDKKELFLIVESPTKLEKFATVLEPKDRTKVFNTPINGPTTVWFDENDHVVSNKIRVYNPTVAYTYIRYETDAHAIPKIIAETKDLEGVLQIIAALFPEDMYTRIGGGTHTFEPSPGHLQTMATTSSILDILLELLRIPRGPVSHPTIEREIGKKISYEKGDYEGLADRTYDYSVIFNKWTTSFAERKLAVDNSLINYSAYVLISLKLIDIFARLDKVELRKKLLNRLMGNICSLINEYRASKTTAEDILLFISTVLYLKSEITSSAKSVLDFEIDRRIIANLPGLESLSFSIDKPLKGFELKLNILAKLHEMRMTINNESGIYEKMIASMTAWLIIRKKLEPRWETIKKLISDIPEIHDDLSAWFVSCILQFIIVNDYENRSKIKQEIEKRLTNTTLRHFRRILYNDVLDVV